MTKSETSGTRAVGILLVCLIVLVGVGGCSGTKRPSPVKITDYRAAPASRETVELSVSRREFVASVDRTKANDRLRLVPVFRRESGGRAALPEYRLFDVGRDSPYALIGLSTADILVAADDYLVYEPEGFRRYVKLLGNEKAVSVEVVRDGRPILLRTTFIDEPG
jgi:type II secretory pathway component PulC